MLRCKWQRFHKPSKQVSTWLDRCLLTRSAHCQSRWPRHCRDLGRPVILLQVLLSLLLLTSPSHATTLTLNIDNQIYHARLTPRDTLAQPLFAKGEHFSGVIEEAPEAWLRISRIKGRWQGLVSMNSGFYLVETAAVSMTGRAASSAIPTRSISQASLPFQCGVELDGVESGNDASADFRKQKRNTVDKALRTTLGGFENLCNADVDGICAVVELEMAFDSDFVKAFPDSYEAQAASLINMVDGIYSQTLGVRFETLKTTFLQSGVFSSNATSSTYLNEITHKKTDHSLPFVVNPQAILHVVRGTPFTDDVTAGIAWVSGLCSDSGYAAGTSVLYRETTNGPASLPITALVTAHEIGHNLGADHDNTASVSCPAGFIMEAVVNPMASDFSNCSKTAIKTLMGNLSTLTACTDYPVSMTISALPSNNLILTAPAPVTHEFILHYQQGYSKPVKPQWIIALNGASNVSARIGSTACVASDKDGALHCNYPRTATETLTLSFTPQWTVANITITSTTGDDSNFFNLDSPSRLTYDVATPGPASPSGLMATLSGESVELSWQDNSIDETGFEIERRTINSVWTTIAATTENVTHFTDAEPGTQGIEYRVLATGNAIVSAPSNVASIAASVVSPPQATDEPKKSGGKGGAAPYWFVVLLVNTPFIRRLRRPIPS